MHYICSNAIFVSVTKIVDFDSMYGLQHLKITIKANHIETILSSIIKRGRLTHSDKEILRFLLLMDYKKSYLRCFCSSCKLYEDHSDFCCCSWSGLLSTNDVKYVNGIEALFFFTLNLFDVNATRLNEPRIRK